MHAQWSLLSVSHTLPVVITCRRKLPRVATGEGPTKSNNAGRDEYGLPPLYTQYTGAGYTCYLQYPTILTVIISSHARDTSVTDAPRATGLGLCTFAMF